MGRNLELKGTKTTEGYELQHHNRVVSSANMLTSDLSQEARKKLNTIRKCENYGPLTAKDVYPLGSKKIGKQTK